MPFLSDQFGWQLSAHIQKFGAQIEYRGQTYRCIPEKGVTRDVGTDLLPNTSLGVYKASEDPTIFLFDPQDFQPTTGTPPPQEGEELVWHQLRYQITHVTYEDVSDNTAVVVVYAFRMVV